MKRYTAELTLAFFLGLLALLSPAQEPTWLNQYGNSKANLGLKLAYDGHGGLYGVGRAAGSELEIDDTTVSINGLQDILLIHLDTSGALRWARTAGAFCPPTTDDDGSGLVVHDEQLSRTIIAGTFSCDQTLIGNNLLDGSNNIMNQFVASYDSNGSCLWASSASGFDIRFVSILASSESTVSVFGSAITSGISFHTVQPVSLPTGGFIAKYSADGTFLDAQRILVNGELVNASWTGADTWVLTGAARPNATLYGTPLETLSLQSDAFIAKTDTTGTVAWIRMFPSHGFAKAVHGASLPNERTMVCGYFRTDLLLPDDTLTGPSDQHTCFLSVLDASGTPEWTLPIQGSAYVFIKDAKVGPDGDIYLYGRYDGSLSLGELTLAPNASTSGFVARFSTSGECKGAWGFGRLYYGSGSILPTSDGLYLSTEFDSTIVLGSYTVQGTYQGPERRHDLLVARFDSLSGFTNVPAPKGSTNDRLHIYANPNDGICTIELPAAVMPGSDLLLTIHDAMGREVQRVPLRWQEGTIRLDIRAQAKGVYHAELMDGPRRYSGTIVFQ